MAKERTYTGERFDWKRGDQLASGGQGTTWEATKLQDNSTGWVLKLLQGDRTKPFGRLKREIEALDTLDCEGVPRLEDYSLGPTPFLVTPNAGKDISKALAASGFPPLRQALSVLRRLAEATKCAHDH